MSQKDCSPLPKTKATKFWDKNRTPPSQISDQIISSPGQQEGSRERTDGWVERESDGCKVRTAARNQTIGKCQCIMAAKKKQFRSLFLAWLRRICLDRLSQGVRGKSIMKQFSVSVPAATFPVLSVTSPAHTPYTVGYLPSTYSLHSGLPPRPDLRPCSRVASLLERKPGRHSACK